MQISNVTGVDVRGIPTFKSDMFDLMKYNVQYLCSLFNPSVPENEGRYGKRCITEPKQLTENKKIYSAKEAEHVWYFTNNTDPDSKLLIEVLISRDSQSNRAESSVGFVLVDAFSPTKSAATLQLKTGSPKNPDQASQKLSV